MKLLIVVGLIAGTFIVFMSGCRSEKKQSVPSSTNALASALAGTGNSPDGALVTLAGIMSTVTKKYYQETNRDAEDNRDSMLGVMIDSAALLLSSRLFMENDPERIVKEFTWIVFDKWGLEFIEDRTSTEYLFPSNVLQKNQGSCVGLSLLYLLIAEKSGHPFYGVLVPGHFFVRYDDGNRKINIEMMKQGTPMPDEWYREKFSSTDTNLYPLKNLTVNEVGAVVNYNAGTILFHQNNYAAAEHFLRKSIVDFPAFAEAHGNLALVLDTKGASHQALAILTSLKTRSPGFYNIDRNIASLQLKCGSFTDALNTYQRLCRDHPSDPHLLYGQGVTLYKLKKIDKAREAVTKALAIDPRFLDALQLRTLLDEEKSQ